MIGFDRPWSLALLAVPLLVAWIAARSAALEREATGTLRLWREVGASAARARAQRRTPPLALWFLVGALCAAVLAIAGPRATARAGAERWRAIVDRSPSMYLPLDSGTRLDRALELALEAADGGAIAWCAASGEFVVPGQGESLPEAWHRAPRGAWDEPRWELFDEPGTLWVTDRGLGLAPRFAALAASGGEAVPGVVADDGRQVWIWDGASLGPRPAVPPRARRWFVAPELERTPLARAADAWATARGFERSSAAADAELALVLGGEGAPRSVDCSVGAWRVSGSARALAAAPDEPSRSALRCGEIDVVRARAGVVEVGWTDERAPGGDDTQYALYWARLFDETALPGPGVPVEERSTAGEPRILRGTRPEDAARDNVWPAWLGTLAALLALLALAVRR